MELTKENARDFDSISETNYQIVKMSLDCSCEPYQDVLTLKRWNKLGYRVRKGEKSIKVTTYRKFSEKDDTGKVIKEYSRPWISYLFCKCQVEKNEKEI